MNRKLFLLIALLAATLAASCVRRARPVNRQQIGAPGGGAAQPGAVAADPRETLERVEAYMSEQGFTRPAPAVRNTQVAVNTVNAYGIDAQPNTCYTVVALASGSADLNIIVLDAQGQTIGYDVRPDPHPWVTVCPGSASRIVARLQMAGGGGDYYYAVYQGPMSTRPDLTAFFSGGSTDTGPRQADLDQATAQRIANTERTLSNEGFTRISDPFGLMLTGPEIRRFNLNLAAGTCYAFATFGGQGVADTDVFLVDGQGNALQRDVSADVDALIRYCPSQTGAYHLDAKMYRGNGALFTVGYQQQAQGATAQTTPPPPAETVMASTSTAGAGLDENFRLLDADIRARGYQSYGDNARGELPEGQTRDFRMQLEGGKCYAILAVGDNGIRDLDLILKDGSGRTIDRDIEVDARPVVRVCPQQTGAYTVSVSMARGGGAFVYAPYRWPRGTRGPFGLSGLIYVRLGEVTSLLGVEGFNPDENAAPAQGTLAREGATENQNVRLQGGQCYAILAVGGDGLNNVNLSLHQGSNRIAADDTRTAFPTVRHCPDRTGRFRVEVGAGNGSGRYFIQVFKRGN